MSDYLLTSEQEDLLRRLIEACHRLQGRREPFRYMRNHTVAADIAIFMHPGWPKDSPPVYLGDLDALAEGRYILRKSLGLGWQFELTGAAFAHHQSLKRPADEGSRTDAAPKPESSESARPPGRLSVTDLSAMVLAEEHPKDRRVFCKHGALWFVVYDGVAAWVRHSIGMSYIAYLLQAPGQEVQAAVLRDLVSGNQDTTVLGPPGDVMDKTALERCREELSDVRVELAQARANNDAGTVADLAMKEERILAEVRSATGLYGKPRKAASDRERVRKSVFIAILRARLAIKTAHRPLWKHLRTYLDTGNCPCYRADQPTSWST